MYKHFTGVVGSLPDTYGTEGRIWWNDWDIDRLHIESRTTAFGMAPRRTHHFTAATTRGYNGAASAQQVREFIAALYADGPRPAPGRAALRMALVTEAIYESARTGTRVAVPRPDL